MQTEPVQSILTTRPHRHIEVVHRLESQIRGGQLAQGSRISGERELAKAYGVSRVTLRKALQELRQKGLLSSDQAKGWFVTAASVEEKNVLRSFTELAGARGFAVSSHVLGVKSRPSTAEEAEIFRSQMLVFEVQRVRFMGADPIGVETSRVPLARCPAIEHADLSTTSIHALLKEAGAAPVSADYVLTATISDRLQAKHLKVKPGFPLLLAEAITRDVAGLVVEISSTVFRSDRYRFHTTLRAR